MHAVQSKLYRETTKRSALEIVHRAECCWPCPVSTQLPAPVYLTLMVNDSIKFAHLDISCIAIFFGKPLKGLLASGIIFLSKIARNEAGWVNQQIILKCETSTVRLRVKIIKYIFNLNLRNMF